MLRILTDRGKEYCDRPEQHDYQLYLAINDIDHTRTKVKSPQMSICERFHKTVLDDCYSVAMRKKIYDDLKSLQADLDAWIRYCNHERTHQGKDVLRQNADGNTRGRQEKLAGEAELEIS